MNAPLLSISSQLTTQLMLLRNVQGSEENWVEGEAIINNRALYCGKVFATEIGCILLLTAATIETVAYSTFLVLSFPLRLCTKRISNLSLTNRISSSAFTIYWNLGNLLVFNFLYSNLHTHESFVRHSLDNSERGDLLKCCLHICRIAIICFALFYRTPVGMNCNFFDQSYTRPQDSLFIYDTLVGSGYRRFVNRNSLNFLENRARILLDFGQGVGESIRLGSEFFRDEILNRIATESRQLVIDNDPEIYPFVTTRAIYVCLFTPLRNQPIPTFFKAETQIAIAEMRELFNEASGTDLRGLMLNHTEFNNDNQSQLLRRLKNIAYREIQGGIFVTRCWQNGCRDYLQ